MGQLVFNEIIKNYGQSKTALHLFSETFSPGVIGLLGPNGAGKSTLMNLIATLSTPSKGKITYDGKDIVKKPGVIREKLGYLPQVFGVFPNLTAIEFLQYIGLIKGLSTKYLTQIIPHYLDIFNLSHVAKKPISTYSGGMRQRIGIIQALLGDPEIILLDEPTVGLDPEERINFRNLIHDISKEKIILLSSHIVSDIETIADRILIMKNGKTLFSGDHYQAVKQVDGKVSIENIAEHELPAYKEKYLITDIRREADGYQIRYVNPTQQSSSEVNVKPALEDTYMYLTESAV